MQKILNFFNKEFINVNQAALILGFFAFFSQILGLLRDRSIAHFIGPSASLDIYYAAFRVPDFIFISIGSLFSVAVLIPFLSKTKINSDPNYNKDNEDFFNNILSFFILLIIFISVIIFFLLPFFINFLVPGFSLENQNKVVELSRFMLLSPIFLGLSNLFSSLNQLSHKFFIYALSPLFYNIGIILGILFFYPILGLKGLAIGVILGAFMHFLIQFLGFSFQGSTLRIQKGRTLEIQFFKSINFTEIKEIIFISFPRTLGLSLNSLTLMFIVSFASSLESGSISIFNFSFNLYVVPLSIIGLSYAVATFPALSQSYASGKMEEFKNYLKLAARQIIFWSLPVIFLFIILRAQIVRVILGSGNFSWENTRLVAASLAIFSISILAQGLIALFARAYYAKGNTSRPLFINFISSLSIIIFSILFLYIFKHYILFQNFIESILKVSNIPGTEILMLPLAYSFGVLINASLFYFFIKKDILEPKEKFISETFFQCLSASFAIGLVSYFMLNILASRLNTLSPVFGTNTFLGIFLQGFLAGILGILAGILILFLFKNEELKQIIKVLKTKFWKVKISVQDE